MPSEIDYLLKGHQKFRSQYFKYDSSLYQHFAKHGQKPRFMIIACSDSRVDPSILFNCQPGDLFVIRNVANLIPPSELDSHYHGTSAALEFGICHLGIRHVVVLGHSQCGGITSLIQHQIEHRSYDKNGFLAKWMELANSACEETLADYTEQSLSEQADHCAKLSIQHCLKNLRTFSWVEERISHGDLFLHGWYFELTSGKISIFNSSNQQFE